MPSPVSASGEKEEQTDATSSQDPVVPSEETTTKVISEEKSENRDVDTTPDSSDIPATSPDEHDAEQLDLKNTTEASENENVTSMETS